MNTYRSQSDLQTKLENLAQRQPELLIVGALAGGFLLGYFLKNVNSGNMGRNNRLFNDDYSAYGQSRAQAGAGATASPRSSARLGATEDQINRSPQQSAAGAVSRDEVSTTGTAYELDPKSITGG
ncbi:MAG: hypothetical protein NT075_02580 [Chloroflexi bacterium]|nr:hypothetical protein [Chloroflexota bacterium]